MLFTDKIKRLGENIFRCEPDFLRMLTNFKFKNRAYLQLRGDHDESSQRIPQRVYGKLEKVFITLLLTCGAINN